MPYAGSAHATRRHFGQHMIVEEIPEGFLLRFVANTDNGLFVGRNCDETSSQRFLLGLCRELLDTSEAKR
jgi:hypothetical protein